MKPGCWIAAVDDGAAAQAGCLPAISHTSILFLVRLSTQPEIWILTSGTTKPTKEDLDAKVLDLTNEEPMKLLRRERDILIAQSDWRVTKAKETGTNIPTAWKTYRQALRDLPASSTPTIDSGGKLNRASVTWPTEPS